MAPILSFSYHNGEKSGLLLPEKFAPVPETLDQVSSTLPAGVYTTFRTYNHTRALHLDQHFDRLEESAYLAEHPFTLDRQLLRLRIREALEQFAPSEARVRITLPFSPTMTTVNITLDALSIPGLDQRTNGVAVVTAHLQRQNPSAKLSSFIRNSTAIRSRLKEGYEEVLMVDPTNSILEGLTSNFFALSSGILLTAGTGMLAGTTRAMVLDIARQAGISIQLQAPRQTQQADFSEAFITSTSRGVLPVVEIDHQPVGDGRPGAVTNQLARLFEQAVADSIAPI
jgi:branched-chain amino acid aminotransferase